MRSAGAECGVRSGCGVRRGAGARGAGATAPWEATPREPRPRTRTSGSVRNFVCGAWFDLVAVVPVFLTKTMRRVGAVGNRRFVRVSKSLSARSLRPWGRQPFRCREAIVAENRKLPHRGPRGWGAPFPCGGDLLRSASQISLMAASSFGKCPRVLMIFRSCAWTLSSAFVVTSTCRMSGGNAKNGITCDQARRQAATTVGNFAPHGPRSNASSAAPAPSALGAV